MSTMNMTNISEGRFMDNSVIDMSYSIGESAPTSAVFSWVALFILFIADGDGHPIRKVYLT